MYLCYDLEANALYVGLASEGSVARTHTIDEGTMVDVDGQGAVIGIEVINPHREWPIDQIKERFKLPADQSRLLELLVPPRIAFAKEHQTFSNVAFFCSVTEDRISAYSDFLWEPSQHVGTRGEMEKSR
ncbi:DUF2283 domain-containing protein [Candidatus Spongiisocius sp.]|uniref:DUF2283 domain-containing protein n=1 Tax=Candidatus Spongiisocius sp. TaxID=3101273 RepID=UPI003B5A4F99